ncbi:MAG TPA: VWA domain-containing protein [Thermoanaerobaculia bacterium]|nr:VWA domain-containing protein [Thermoanaerobaculia bacterium]
MRELSRTRTLLAVLLLTGLAGAVPPPGISQEEPAAEFGEQVSVGYVLVPVIVRSGTGYARNLDQEDFKLLVDGRPARIESFERRAEAPASVVFLQDLSGSMENAGKIEISREVVRFFLKTAVEGDEFSLATFAGGIRQVEVPFTGNRATLAEAVTGWEAYGTTALHDAVAWVPEISLEGRNPKRFAILITDGVDNASQIPPEQAREIVRSAQLPVYVLGLQPSDLPRAPKPAPAANGAAAPATEAEAQAQAVYRYADLLQELAASTGGRYYSISGPDDLREVLTGIIKDFRHQYVLGFATGEGPSRYRALTVEVRGRNRPVLFRRGYQGPPPPSPTGG